MSVRALFPIAALGGLTYWLYSKDKVVEKSDSGDEDPDPLEELVREKGKSE